MTLGKITRVKFVRCDDGLIAATAQSELFSLRIRFSNFLQWGLVLKNFGYKARNSGYFIHMDKYKEMFKCPDGAELF